MQYLITGSTTGFHDQLWAELLRHTYMFNLAEVCNENNVKDHCNKKYTLNIWVNQ